MLLSMWVICSFLEKYHPEAHIQSGKMELRGVRILSETQIHVHDNLYIAYADEYIDNSHDKVICVHGKDMILLQTTDIHEVFNTVLDCFDFYNRWEVHCQNIIQKGCTLQELLDASSSIIIDRLYVVDRSYLVSAELAVPLFPEKVKSHRFRKQHSLIKTVEEEKSLPLDYIAHLRQNKTLHYMKSVPLLFSVGNGISPNYVMGLFCDEYLEQYLVELNFNTDPSPAKEQLFVKMGGLVERWIEKNQQPLATDTRKIPNLHNLFRRIFLSDETINKKELLELQTHIEKIGWLPSAKKKVYIISNQVNDEGILLPLCRKLNNQMDYMAECIDNFIFLISNESTIDPNKSQNFLLQNFLSTNCRAGTSYQFSDILLLPENIRAAWIAWRQGLQVSGHISSCDEYILPYLKEIVLRNMSVDFSHPAAQILLNYDYKHQTQLSETLFYFLLNERSYSQTADELYVHRNTIQYRINKVLELTELNLDDKRTRMHMLVSLLLLQKNSDVNDSSNLYKNS